MKRLQPEITSQSLILEAENLICITEDKIQDKILKGFARNINNSEAHTKRIKNESGLRICMILTLFVSEKDFILYSLQVEIAI
uniref:Uncharacterized protein n=1 Tax=Rhizophagus irregularis (strain DAOM 181602 / DAOM 197198 / MUCL 43194) TaxID=747089 RepID=U9TDP4_RHIID